MLTNGWEASCPFYRISCSKLYTIFAFLQHQEPGSKNNQYTLADGSKRKAWAWKIPVDIFSS